MSDTVKLSKGGGGGSPGQTKQTLRSTVTGKFIHLISEGPVQGLVGGAQGIYFNDTPLGNSTGGYNFADVTWAERTGQPTQDIIPGFSAVENEVSVGVVVTAATPVVRQITSPGVDAARITIQLTKGLYQSSGSQPSSVAFSIAVRTLPSGTFSTVVDTSIDGAIFGPYERSYNVQLPAGGTSGYEIQITRKTPDPGSDATICNEIALARYTEIEQVQETYDNSAIVGITFDATSVDQGQFPTCRYLMQGLICRVPSNYNASTKVYSGVWDYTFQYAWTDNPIWCALELMTNTRWGLGEYVPDSVIAMSSVYNAAVYCDGSVTYTDASGNSITEPRFTLNCVIDQPDDPITTLQRVLNVAHANFTTHNGLIYINQDRPTSTTAVIAQTDVIAGSYWEESSSVTDRNTEITGQFNNKAINYKRDSITRSASSTVLNTLDYNPLRIDIFGATSVGQVDRELRWMLDTQQYQTRIAHWQMGVDALELKAFDVVEVMMPFKSGRPGNSGRIVSISGTTVVLDRQATITSGSIIDIVLADGTVESANITSPNGTTNTITIDTAPPSAVTDQCSYIIKADVYPQLFRIKSITPSAIDTYDVVAITYDPNKWSRVEGQPTTAHPPTWSPDLSQIGAPTNIVFTESADVSSGSVVRGLTISWQPSAIGQTKGYALKWRVNGGPYTLVQSIDAPVYTIPNLAAGTVDVTIYAYGVGVNGNLIQSVGTDASYTIDNSSGTGSALLPVTNLQVFGGGTSFTGPDLKVQWTNPIGNGSIATTLRDFQVILKNPSTSTVFATYYIAPVAAGATATVNYTYNNNAADNGGTALRSLICEVRCRDTNNKTSNVTSATFSNPAPAAVNGFTVTGMYKGMQLTWTRPTDTDYVGVLVWQGTTSTFTPSQSNCVFEGDATLAVLSNLTAGSTYYYKIAAYDTFGKDYTGTGLNVSGATTGVALQYPGTPGGSTLPTTGMQDGDLFYNTTTKHLYVWNAVQNRWVMQGIQQGTTAQMNAVTGMLAGDQFYNTDDHRTYTYNGSKWIASSVLTGSSLPASGNVGDLAYNTSDGLLYRWNGTSWVSTLPTTALSGQIQAGQIAANAVAANQIAAGTLSAGVVYAGSLSASQITSGTMSAGYITSGTLSADRIYGGTLNAGTIQVLNLSAAAINTGTLDCSVVNVTNLTANKITSTSSTALNSYVGTLTVMNNSGQSYIHSNGKLYGDGNWGYILGADANNSATWMDVQNGSGQIKMHTNGDFLITAGNGAMTLTQNGLTINQLNVIGTAQINNFAVTQAYAISTPAPTGSTPSSQDATVSVTVPSNCSAVLIVANFGTVSVSSGGEAGTGGSTAQASGSIIVNGTDYVDGYGLAHYVFASPGAGTYTVTARRFIGSGSTYGGPVSVYALVSKK
jgi:hypothetical protein